MTTEIKPCLIAKRSSVQNINSSGNKLLEPTAEVYSFHRIIIDIIYYNVIWTDNGSMLPEADTQR